LLGSVTGYKQLVQSESREPSIEIDV